MKPLQELLRLPFIIMGILNVTPDSFYDGGKHPDPGSAIDQGHRLIEGGADVIDVGGESTRPGSVPVSTEEECRRIVPVIDALSRTGVPISVDTTKSEVARRSLDAGASWINDVSAGRFDPGMAPLAAKRQCPIVLMHSRANPQTMQDRPFYRDVIAEVRSELLERVGEFLSAGLDRSLIILDPGFGFAKRIEDNLRLLHNLEELASLGFPLLIGTSRKSFVGHITGKPAEQRLAGTLATLAWAFGRGARIFRVHDAAETRDFLTVLSTIEHIATETV